MIGGTRPHKEGLQQAGTMSVQIRKSGRCDISAIDKQVFRARHSHDQCVGGISAAKQPGGYIAEFRHRERAYELRDFCC